MLAIWKNINIFSILLFPLSLLYGAISWFNILLRSKNTKKYRPFVISVGNLTVGGAGKTPLVVSIANHLNAAGYKVAVIGHGYKAKIHTSKVVDSCDDVAIIGDEAMQMYKLLHQGVKVAVGKKRHESIMLVNDWAQVIILDDGYTATNIHRDYNLLVVDGNVQLGNKLCLPAGPLREPLCGIKRADAMVLINYQKKLSFNFAKDSFYLRSKISFSESLKTKSLFAFCGLALPEKFYNSLSKEGLSIKEKKNFPDHYNYKSKDIEKIISRSRKKSLQLVTTLKDFVKLPKEYTRNIELIMLEIQLTKGFINNLEQKIKVFYR